MFTRMEEKEEQEVAELKAAMRISFTHEDTRIVIEGSVRFVKKWRKKIRGF